VCCAHSCFVCPLQVAMCMFTPDLLRTFVYKDPTCGRSDDMLLRIISSELHMTAAICR